VQFLYYIPDRTNAPPELLASLGIASVLGCSPTFGYIDSGPGGSGGVLVAASVGAATPLCYKTDGWRWIPRREPANDAGSPGKVLFYLGVPTPAPGPCDLARGEMLEGNPVALADGNEWVIPIGRFYDGGTPLGRRITLDADGNDTLTVLASRKVLWDAACETWEKFVTQHIPAEPDISDRPDSGMTLLRGKQIASACLAANYRLGEFEVSALGLLSTDNIRPALSVLIDLASFEELLKKKQDGAE
jgi:hypothetical protein